MDEVIALQHALAELQEAMRRLMMHRLGNPDEERPKDSAAYRYARRKYRAVRIIADFLTKKRT